MRPDYPCPRPIRGELATGRPHMFEGALSECGRWFRFRHGGCTWYLRIDDLEEALCMSTAPHPEAIA